MPWPVGRFLQSPDVRLWSPLSSQKLVLSSALVLQALKRLVDIEPVLLASKKHKRVRKVWVVRCSICESLGLAWLGFRRSNRPSGRITSADAKSLARARTFMAADTIRLVVPSGLNSTTVSAPTLVRIPSAPIAPVSIRTRGRFGPKSDVALLRRRAKRGDSDKNARDSALDSVLPLAGSANRPVVGGASSVTNTNCVRVLPARVRGTRTSWRSRSDFRYCSGWSFQQATSKGIARATIAPTARLHHWKGLARAQVVSAQRSMQARMPA
jgi:hypothetical protein